MDSQYLNKRAFEDTTNLILILVHNHFGRSFVDLHSALGTSVILLELRIHQEKWLAVLLWTLLEGLLKKISCSF